jgi:hypothetical protein
VQVFPDSYFHLGVRARLEKLRKKKWRRLNICVKECLFEALEKNARKQVKQIRKTPSVSWRPC